MTVPQENRVAARPGWHRLRPRIPDPGSPAARRAIRNRSLGPGSSADRARSDFSSGRTCVSMGP